MKPRRLHTAHPPPAVSIILCTYNRKRLLPRALRSVKRQTFHLWELVIVDDGSTDGSEKLLLSFARKNSRVVYIRHDNQGLAQSRNVGLALARGQYVTFVDSDDEYTRDHLARHMAYLQSHPSLHAVFGGMKIVGPRRKHFVPDVLRPGRRIHVSKCHAAGTLFAKRSSMAAVRGFRSIPFSEDYDLIRRLSRRFRVRRINIPSYIYHVDSKNRLCDLFEQGGAPRIQKYREGH